MNSLEIRNFSLVFRMYDTGIRKTDLQVITDLNLSLRPGEIHAVVGSSGSGKSLLAHAILGILPRNASCGGEMLVRAVINPCAAEEAERKSTGSGPAIRELSGPLDASRKTGQQKSENGYRNTAQI